MIPQKPAKLGKIVAIHGITPAFLQRTVIIAVMSFVFFAVTMLMFSVWRNFLYFFLSSAFLIVYLLTMFGWLMLRKNVLKIYEKGITYRKFTAVWEDLESVTETSAKGRKSFEVATRKGAKITLTDTLVDVEKAVAFIREVLANAKSPNS